MISTPTIDAVLADPHYGWHRNGHGKFYVTVYSILINGFNRPVDTLVSKGNTWDEAFEQALINIITLRLKE